MKQKNKKQSLDLLFLSGLWAIDIGASVMNMESSGFPTLASSLFMTRTGVQQYHLGLLFSIVAFGIIVGMWFYEVKK